MDIILTQLQALATSFYELTASLACTSQLATPIVKSATPPPLNSIVKTSTQAPAPTHTIKTLAQPPPTPPTTPSRTLPSTPANKTLLTPPVQSTAEPTTAYPPEVDIQSEETGSKFEADIQNQETFREFEEAAYCWLYDDTYPEAEERAIRRRAQPSSYGSQRFLILAADVITLAKRIKTSL